MTGVIFTPSLAQTRNSMEFLPPNLSELRMVLLGKNSSEISRVGNFILGREAFNTEALPPSVEQHSERAGGTVEGRYITLVSTPHLFHPQLTKTNLDKRVRECMTLCSPGPHVLALVLQPDDFTETDTHRLNSILRSLSEDPHEHILVLTTCTVEEGTSVDPVQENITQKIGTKCYITHLDWSESSRIALLEMSEKINEETGGSLNCEEFEDAKEHLDEKLETADELDKHVKTEEQLTGLSEQAKYIQTAQQAHEKQNENARTKQNSEKAPTNRLKQLMSRIPIPFSGRSTPQTPAEGRMEGKAKTTKWNLMVCGRKSEAKAFVSKLLLENQSEVCGRLIRLVELPPLYCSQLSEEEVMRETLHCVSLCDPGVHAFLLVLPEEHLTDEDKGELEKIQKIFSSSLRSHSLVLIAQQLQNKQLDESVHKMIKCVGELYASFNDKTDLMTQIKKLLEKNGGGHYTMAMFCGAQVETQLKFKREITNLQEQISYLQIMNMNQEQVLSKSPDDLRIVLLGKTGVGKSATGNTILGKENIFEEAVFGKSVTKECLKNTAEVNGRQITVIDTPGLFDTSISNEVITKEITKCICMAAPGPHVFLLVLKVGQRFTKEEDDAVKMIQDTFGDTSKRFTIVLFTRGDELKGHTIEKYIEKSGAHLQNYLLAAGNRYHVFNNSDKTSSVQVTELLKKIDSMVKVNGGNCYTNEMFQQVEKTLQEEQQRILREREEEIEREKEELRTKHEAEMEKLRKQMQEQKERQEEEDRKKEEAFKERENEIKKDMAEREKTQIEYFEKRRADDEKRMNEWKAEINTERGENRKQWEKQREEDQRRRDQEEEERKNKEEEWKKKQKEEKDHSERERKIIQKEKENQQKLLREYEKKKQEEEKRVRDLEEKIKNAEESTKKELQEQLSAQQKEWEKIEEEKKKREEQQINWVKRMASIEQRSLELIREQQQYELEKHKEKKEREKKEIERKEKEETERKRIETEANEKLKKMEEEMKSQREKDANERRERDEQHKKEMEEKLKTQQEDFRREREERADEEKRTIDFIKETHNKEMEELRIQTEHAARKQAEEKFNKELDEKVKKAKDEGVELGRSEVEAERTYLGRKVDKLVNKVF